MAETSKDAEAAFDAFIATYELKYDKAAECLAKDRQALLAFYDFPAGHWKHLRTSNPIESTFAVNSSASFRSLFALALAISSRRAITPGIGAYWLCPFFMALFTSFISSGEVSKSGKPCDKLIAPTSAATADITVNIVVPTCGSLDMMRVIRR